MNGELEYLRLLRKCREEGERKENRTGIDTFALPPQTLVHDMSEGFPLLTTKDVAFKPIRTELEFFIKGLTDKSWLQKRGNTIWNQWARPSDAKKILDTQYESDPAMLKKAQAEANDLGPVYGRMWRRFNNDAGHAINLPVNVERFHQDQLASIVNKLKTNPNDRRMVCSAWAPAQLDEQALPPCHLMWIVNHINGKLHLQWTQRSVDAFLGLPFNIASYALLLHLLCLESGFEPGTVTGTLVDFHIYENHLDAIDEQLSRTPYDLPTVETKDFTSIFDWDYSMTKSVNYKHHSKINAEVAV